MLINMKNEIIKLQKKISAQQEQLKNAAPNITEPEQMSKQFKSSKKVGW